jgi:phosphonopyruvate decarboxylase
VIDPKKFIKILEKNKISFFTGVPDSLLKEFCLCLEKKKNHLSSINEGAAVSIGVGYHLAKKKIPLVYLQNSGLGNIVNPVVSLVNKNIFQIPIFFLIGWRGEIEQKNIKSKKKDEPQHIFQGKITRELLKTIGIKYKILDSKSNYKTQIRDLKKYASRNSCPVALLVRKNTFKKSKNIILKRDGFLKREEIVNIILRSVSKNTPVISTTGYLSRELMKLNNKLKKTNDFYSVGGMGHAISIATGLAFCKKKRKIICLDGDGAALMHLGAQVSASINDNLIHILINNGVHDSVGGQRIAGSGIKFKNLAKELGYKNSFLCKSEKNIKNRIKSAFKQKGSCFLEILSSAGAKKGLIRPDKPMIYYKKQFIKKL